MVQCVCGNHQYMHMCLCLCCGDRLLMVWVFFAQWTSTIAGQHACVETSGGSDNARF
jgi:hypothetical protein